MIVDNKFKVIRKLGDGHQATTFLVTMDNPYKESCLKLFKKSYDKMSDREKNMFNNEIQMGKPTMHDNLVTVHSQHQGAAISEQLGDFDPNTLYPQIEMEYVCNGELFHYLYYTNNFTETTLRIIMRQLVDGLVWLRKFNLSHNDLKPENILLDEYFIIRIADQGFTRGYEEKCREMVSGTRMQTSPQINEKREYSTEKADMFALGVILYLLQFRNPCFKDADQKKDKHFNELIKNKRLGFQLDKVEVSAEFKSTLLGLLNYDEEARTSLAQLDANPWINNFTGEEQDKQMAEFKQKKSVLDKLIPPKQ